jgi:PKD domain-containing protein
MRIGLTLRALPATAAICLASPWTTTAGADAAQVTVVSPGGKGQTLSLAAMAGGEDVVNRPYVLRSSGGESTQTVTGFSLAALLDAAGADPYGFSYLEVQRPAGGSVLLGREQALDPSAFPDDPPVVYATAAGTGFLRPSAGAGDANAADSFEAPQGLTVVLRKGSPLQVRARASTVRTRPGEPVSFEAIVERAGAGESLAYSWYFDDGHSAEGSTTRHAFAKRGSYDVVLGVTSGGDEAGTSAVVTIQVGAPLAGPDRKGGGRSRAADAPDHGAAAGPSGGESGAAPATSAPEASPPAHPDRESQPPGRRPVGETVSGELLDSAQSPPEAQPPAARRGHLDDGEGRGGLPTAAWGALAILGLLGLGALGEARGGGWA